MRIVIAGGSGFLGSPLARALEQDGHDIVILSRSAAAKSAGSQVMWTPDGAAGPWASAVAGAGAVVNLAGEPIAAKRWTSAQKQRILESRRLATRRVNLGTLRCPGAVRPADLRAVVTRNRGRPATAIASFE